MMNIKSKTVNNKSIKIILAIIATLVTITTIIIQKINPIPGIVNSTDGAKYYKHVQVTYYNPGSSTRSAGPCTLSLYIYNPDKYGTTGCLKWYAYSSKETPDATYVNMILDHNINDLCSDDNCKWASNNNSAGPVLALSTLDYYTSSWQTETPKVPNKYGEGGTENNPQIVPTSANNNKYSIDYSGYKARLITKEEIERIKSTNNNSIPSELYENLPQNSPGAYGYWTSSPYADNSSSAWYIIYDGDLYTYPVNYTEIGVRPVITVSNP